MRGRVDRIDALESSFNNAFSDLLRDRGQSDIALAPGFKFDQPISSRRGNFEGDPVLSGEISVEDI
ncbi:MAG: hypothetical protein GY786_05665 [Proteobacteria bacterium]|nr:hypothetical protein [Pseudomonadota bacterium]